MEDAASDVYTIRLRPGIIIGAAIFLGFLMGVMMMVVIIEFSPRSKSDGHLEIDLVPIPHVQPKPERPKGDTGELVKPAIHV